ncbi:hypothetical protein [Nocardia callitridis]|uniref:hypothetical protein n=1 Tax=Nocardia callitridis TaxID=648753 RepID=UPI003CD0A30D
MKTTTAPWRGPVTAASTSAGSSGRSLIRASGTRDSVVVMVAASGYLREQMIQQRCQYRDAVAHATG